MKLQHERSQNKCQKYFASSSSSDTLVVFFIYGGWFQNVCSLISVPVERDAEGVILVQYPSDLGRGWMCLRIKIQLLKGI